MSDTMFYGVLRMPYEMAMENELSRRQFYSRVQEAADRLEVAEAKAIIAPAAQGNAKDAGTPEKLELLRNEFTALLDVYIGVLNSGDMGKWNPDEDESVIQARAAIAASQAAA